MQKADSSAHQAHSGAFALNGAWAVICKASKTGTLWNVAIGWKILGTSLETPGLCTWNSFGGGPGRQTEPWSISYPKENRIFVTRPKDLNILIFWQWNHNDPVLGCRLTSWKTLCGNCFLWFLSSFQFSSFLIIYNKYALLLWKENLIYKKLFSQLDEMQHKDVGNIYRVSDMVSIVINYL
jgi:hypothetical protein